MDERDPDTPAGPVRDLQEWSKSWLEWAGGAATRVQAFDPDDLSTAQVVGIAVGAAGVIGGLLAALGPGEPSTPPRAARATRTRVAARRAAGPRRRGKRAPTEIDGMTLGERATLTFAPLAEGLAETSERAAAQVAQGRAAMGEQLTVLGERGEKMTRRTRKELRRQADDLQKQVQLLQKELAKRSKRAGQHLPQAEKFREVVTTASGTVGKRVAAAGAVTAAAATPLIERARHIEMPTQVRGLADTTRERTVDLTGRVRDEFVPLLIERAGRAREEAERVREEIMPLVAERVHRVREDVMPQVADAATRIGHRFKEAGEGSVADLAGVRQATVAALSAPAPKRRNWVGMSIWAVLITSLVGLVVYYLRDEERRQKAIATAQSIAEQGREIIRDFQGYDEEF